EQVEERDRPIDAGDLDRAVELDHRQPPPGRGDRVALTGVRLLADQQLPARRLPGGQVDDGRLAGKVAARVAGCCRHGVLRFHSPQDRPPTGASDRWPSRPTVLLGVGRPVTGDKVYRWPVMIWCAFGARGIRWIASTRGRSRWRRWLAPPACPPATFPAASAP